MFTVRRATARELWRGVGVALWAAVGLQRRLHAYSGLLRWVSAAAKSVAVAPQGWAVTLELSDDAVQDLSTLRSTLLLREARAGPPQPLPVRLPAAA